MELVLFATRRRYPLSIGQKLFITFARAGMGVISFSGPIENS